MGTQFSKAVELIKSYGFKVYIYKDKEYGYFTDGKNIGYLQYSKFEGFTFDSVHQPCRAAGTGYRIASGIHSVEDITKKLCERCFVTIPKGFIPTEIKNWKNWEHFVSKHWNKALLIEQ